MYTASRYGANGVSGASAYARIGLETGVVAANPHRLILMLFEGARIALSSALSHMKNGEITAKGEAISKTIAIISSGLQASLDVKAGGDLAQKLNALYDYMSRRLLQANLHNKPEYIEEVARLLGELSEAWEAIGSSIPAGDGRATLSTRPVLPASPATFHYGRA
ncbi:MAG: flagellar export chaperone FliS [Pseudomonadota bacterium]|nr:flagellar export chaperone FliS [Pseudomonadota bacterium]